MIATFINAVPIYILSLMYLLYWLEPSRSLPLSIHQLSLMLQVEGLVLFFSIFVVGVLKRRNPVGTIGVLAFVFGTAALFSLGFDAEQRKLFWLLIILHLAGAIPATDIDRSRMYLATWISLPVLFLTGAWAYNFPIPTFAEHYPPGITYNKTFFSRLDGHALLAWGTVYFAIIATLHPLVGMIKYPDHWEH